MRRRDAALDFFREALQGRAGGAAAAVMVSALIMPRSATTHTSIGKPPRWRLAPTSHQSGRARSNNHPRSAPASVATLFTRGFSPIWWSSACGIPTSMGVRLVADWRPTRLRVDRLTQDYQLSIVAALAI